MRRSNCSRSLGFFAACFSLALVSSLLSPGSVPAGESTVDVVFYELVSRGGGMKEDVSDDEGAYLVVVVPLEVPEEESIDQLREKARLLAHRKIAAYLGEEMTGRDEDYLESITTSDGRTEQERSRGYFRSKTQADLNKLLAGIAFIDQKRSGDKVYFGYVLSSRRQKIAGQLAGAGERLGAGQTVVAIGHGSITDGDIQSAKDQAVKQAQKDAIAQVLGTTIAATSRMQNLDQVKSKIFSNTTGYIDSYRIIKEGVSEGSYRVEIEATVSRNKLQQFGTEIKVMGVQFLVDAGEDWELRETFSEFFTGLGFKVTENPAAADYIITVSGILQRVHVPYQNNQGTTAKVIVKMLDSRSREVILSLSNKPVNQTTWVFGDAAEQRIGSLNNALEQLREPLHQRVQDTITSLSQSGRTIRVVFNGYRPEMSDQLSALQSAVSGIAGVTDLNTMINTTASLMVISATYAGKIDDLQEALLQEINRQFFAGGAPLLISMSGNELIFSF